MFLVFTLRDVKAEVFGAPVFVRSLGELVRDIQSHVNSGGDSLIAKHPGDFVLYKLGQYDEQKGRFELLDLPDHVLDCSSLVASRPAPATPVSPGVSAVSPGMKADILSGPVQVPTV